ncbi:hypothetical protein YC2023_016525 [Brassica napus]
MKLVAKESAKSEAVKEVIKCYHRVAYEAETTRTSKLLNRFELMQTDSVHHVLIQ